MIDQSTLPTQPGPVPTIWGLTPVQLHDRFWAARGVQVVRQGEPSEIVHNAELFLLTDARTLAIFKLIRVVDVLSWLKPELLYVRLRDGRELGYQERAIVDANDRFVRFQRMYRRGDAKLARVALTTEPRLAQLWQRSRSAREGWRSLRHEVLPSMRGVSSISATVYDRTDDEEVMQFVRDLLQGWPHPDSTIHRASQHAARIWSDQTSKLDASTRMIGPVWIGAGRQPPAGATIVGPCVLWDDPAHRPTVDRLAWEDIEPTLTFVRPVQPRRLTSISRAAKRLFDILFALVAIILTLPLYPFIMLAIWLEDGRPFFFGHRRETLGGREFPCIKFRSMRKDADEIKKQLQEQNQADGPQFFMDDDPRLTRVGRFIRRTYLDELPQLWNVLLGHMSIVGPRPSPHSENQYCPPWREARLSVRPGLTGLWQIKRTRRRGCDFQEWIKYDLEYVEKMSWGLDLKIIWQTFLMVIRRLIRS